MHPEPAVAVPALARTLSLRSRIVALGSLLAAEILALSVAFDNGALAGDGGLAGAVHNWGAWAVRLAVAGTLAALIFGGTGSRGDLDGIAESCREYAVSWRLLLAHAATFAVFLALGARLYGSHGPTPNLLPLAWLLTGFAAVVLAGCACIPPRIWLRLAKTARDPLAYAAAAAVVACFLGKYAWHFWLPLSHITLAMVRYLLTPFLPVIYCDPAILTIGSPSFNVQIAPECSGYEGMGLMLAFGAAWLWFLRREWRFPHALLLLPGGVAAMFLLNSVRIAALILIGNAGAGGVALGGFHSQAGWLAFNAVALGLCVGARRIPWIARETAAKGGATARAHDGTTAYLLPFLAILAAAMAARALSADFEWFYGLRVVAAVGAIWYCRGTYRKLDWRAGWPAVAAGVGVFALWIGLDRAAAIPRSPAPAALLQASFAARSLWIAFRVAGAVITVPIAEELAFRGYLLRRLSAAEFEGVDWRAFAWLPIVISSAAFGLLHGQRWIAGMVAGMVYAVAMLRRGRIGEAAAAHAITNLLVAGYVLLFGNWQLW